MSPPRPARDRRGLTLIELVLTLTILAVAGALVSGALATALRSWQSGLRSGREELVARIVLERIAAQLRAAIPAPARREEKETVAFDAGDDYLRFVTPAAGAAPVQVFYGIEQGGDGPHLVFREHPWPDKDFFGSSLVLREEDVVEVTGLAIKTVKRVARQPAGMTELGETPAAGGVVEQEWSPDLGELPASVEIEIEVSAGEGAQPRSYSVAVPVLTVQP